MEVHPIDFRYGSKDMRAIFSPEGFLSRALDVEIEVARAQAELGIIPKEAFEELKRAKEKVTLERVRSIERTVRHEIMAIVKALSENCTLDFVHFGLTSNDVIDTARAMQIRDGLDLLKERLKSLINVLVALAEKHRTTLMVGRTHGQHALPITFGFKCCVWISELLRCWERIEEGKKRFLMGKLSGAVGTFASLGKKGFEVQKIVLKRLGLKEPEITTQVLPRDIYAELFSDLAILSTVLARIAREIRQLQRPEIGELEEPFSSRQVGSSAMPHKRNPWMCENVEGLSRVIRSLAMSSFETILLEHERDLTNSSVERILFPEVFLLLEEQFLKMERILKGLKVNAERMKENLERSKGLNLSEMLVVELTPKFGRQKAHEMVRKACMEALEMGKGIEEVKKKLGIREKGGYESYLGLSDFLMERVLKKAHKFMEVG